jgi:L,D-peptidoglycan transpeptidase YkuD (ErfK/YbiS/YcfS/YnhG family)
VILPPDDIAHVTADGLLRFRGQVMRCALGRAGIAVRKSEGDGATPAGLLRLERVLYRADRGARPAASVPVEPLAPNDGWCDDPTHADYNRRITRPFPSRHEALWRDDALYDLIGVLEWNRAPVERGRGSAIFLHLARPDLAPTEGCVALPERELRGLLAAALLGIAVG